MENVKIYLSGGISSLTFEEQAGWRKRVQDAIKYGDYDLKKNPVFFDPTQYYSIFTPEYKSEREVMNFDLHHLRKSDIVVVNFNDKKSIGTAMELILAKEMHIPVIGLEPDGGNNLHPWLVECVDRMCCTMREFVDYVVNFYLT